MAQIKFEDLFSGKAIFTIVSSRTGNRFTYSLDRDKNIKRPNRFYLKVMCGPDNESSYLYLGFIDKICEHSCFINYSLNSKLKKDSLQFIAAQYFFMRHDHPEIQLYHSGRCLKCGKLLTTPESIESGFGPKCQSRRKVKS